MSDKERALKEVRSHIVTGSLTSIALMIVIYLVSICNSIMALKVSLIVSLVFLMFIMGREILANFLIKRFLENIDDE